MDWSTFYPVLLSDYSSNISDGKAAADQTNEKSLPQLSRRVEIADIGCGFGGLLFALAPLFPETLILGLEIRTSVTAFVQEKIKALRVQHLQLQQQEAKPEQPVVPSARPGAKPSSTTDQDDTVHLQQQQNEQDPSNITAAEAAAATTATYNNVACLRANTMKFLPNFFTRGQLSKIFLCFPDPHFKARKHKARIVSAGLAAEYAFVVRPGGRIYTVTDVEDLHSWMVRHFQEFPLFERVSEEGLKGDSCVEVMCEATEESKKVTRNGGKKFVAVFQRTQDPAWP